MGIEYEEYWCVIKNKRTNEEITVKRQLAKMNNKPLFDKGDLEIVDFGVSYG